MDILRVYFIFFALRVDSPLGVRGKEWEKRKNEMHLILTLNKQRGNLKDWCSKMPNFSYCHRQTAKILYKD